MTGGEPRTTFTDADFDTLSWHDCHIHGIELRTGDPADGDWTHDLALDIDFIVGGSCGLDGEVRFLVAPASLVFHEVTNLRIEIDWAGRRSCVPVHAASISRIDRRAGDGSSASRHQRVCEWTIALNWPDGGVIEFEAVGFTQDLRAQPAETDGGQHLSTAQRGRLS